MSERLEISERLEEIEALRAAVMREVNTVRELRAELSSTKAELSNVRLDLADTTKTLDKYRGMHVEMSRANSDLRKSAADLNETLAMITEERDLSRELFQGMVSAYADLLDRYAKSCDDYEDLASRFIWRDDSEHEKF